MVCQKSYSGFSISSYEYFGQPNTLVFLISMIWGQTTLPQSLMYICGCVCVCVRTCVNAGSQAPFLTCKSESLGQSPGICIQHPDSDPLRGAQGLEPWALLQSWAVRTSREAETRHMRDGVTAGAQPPRGLSGATDRCCPSAVGHHPPCQSIHWS